MGVIREYPLPLSESFEVEMPAGAELLSVQMRAGRARLWAVVEEPAPTEKRRFLMHATGQRLSHQGGRFVGTFQVPEHSLVFHLFEVRGPG